MVFVCISFVTGDAQHLFMFCWHFYIFFGEDLLKFFALFLNWSFVLLFLSCKQNTLYSFEWLGGIPQVEMLFSILLSLGEVYFHF